MIRWSKVFRKDSKRGDPVVKVFRKDSKRGDALQVFPKHSNPGDAVL